MAPSRSQRRTQQPNSGSAASSSTTCVLVKPTGDNLDMAWEWNSLMDVNNKKSVTCDFCGKTTTGGITRAKKHQMGVRGDVDACTKTPDEIKAKIMEASEKKKKAVSDAFELKEKDDDEEKIYNIRTGKKRATSDSTSSAKRGKTAKASMDLVLFENPETSIKLGKAKRQASISDALNKEAQARYGSSQKTCPVLNKEVELIKDMLERHEIERTQYGCSIMCDSWTDTKGRTFINFLVNCARGTMFVKSVDASDYMKTDMELFKLLDSFIEEIGERNIVQVVTDNTSNYVLAGEYLEAKRPRLIWTPCAAYCINLMLQDICKIPRVKSVIQKGMFLVSVIYNHSSTMNTMRKFTNKMELVRTGMTRFATTFLTLERLHKQKSNLTRMFTSAEWLNTRTAKEHKGKMAADTVLMTTFWNDVIYILKAMEPLVQFMRLVANEKKPAMGHIYKAMDKAKEAIARSFNKIEAQYSEIFSIIDKRWKCQLHHPLHAAGYFLNPQYFYSDPRVDQDPEVSAALYKCIDRLSPNDDEAVKAIQQLSIYRRSEGLFSMSIAKTQRALLAPAEWWSTYGKHIPCLQTIAIKVLSLTCSLSGRELNRSTFEQIHSKKRSKHGHQKLQDLVFVKYNQALKDRFDNLDSIDPILLNNVDDCNEWLVGEMDEDGEAAEDELVFGDNSLTWGVVADAVGVGEPEKLTRQQKRLKKAAAPTSSSRKRKEVVLQEEEDSEETKTEEEEEEEAQLFKSSSEEENDDDEGLENEDSESI